MKMRDIISLVEAPIADIELQGGDDNTFAQGTSFDKTDTKLLQSPKGQDKIIRAFERTPFVFKVIFKNTQDVDANQDTPNDEVDEFSDDFGSGIYGPHELQGVDGTPGVITVLLLGNLSPVNTYLTRKMPMTGWTLAHKIGHSIQDHMAYRSQGWKNQWGDAVRKINYMIAYAETLEFNDEPMPNPDDALSDPNSSDYTATDHLANRMLTMKSAREGHLDGTSGFEIFAELIAQYLVAGKVTMNVFKGNEQVVDMINQQIYNLFKMLEGKVMVEI